MKHKLIIHHTSLLLFLQCEICAQIAFNVQGFYKRAKLNLLFLFLSKQDKA